VEDIPPAVICLSVQKTIHGFRILRDSIQAQQPVETGEGGQHLPGVLSEALYRLAASSGGGSPI
jgi:hypothetical protein